MISIEFKNLDITDFLDDVRGQTLKEATVKATNRAVSAAYREGSRIMEKERRLEKKGESGFSYPPLTEQSKIRSSNVFEEWACLKTSDKPLSLQNYVEMFKEPEDQKGKPVRKRRKIDVRLRKVTLKPKSFILRVGENNHVFRHDPKQNNVEKKQAVSGVHKVLSKEENQKKMGDKGIAAFERNFDKIFDREYKKIVDKYSDV